MRRFLWSTLVAALLAVTPSSGGGLAALPAASSSSPVSASGPCPGASSAAPAATAVPRAQTIRTGLPVPWGMAFLPDGTALVTLRDRGLVVRVSQRGTSVGVGLVPGVRPGGEGGLLGIAVSPRFTTDHFVFVYLTSAVDNRVLRMTFDGRVLRPSRVIVTGIPKGRIHNGGRLGFGPDRFLYISTGDTGQRQFSQSRASLGGKILRVTVTGAAAPGNPFRGSRIWSLGHRNVQGLAWKTNGATYASELGANTWDELNRILPGRNYGWPIVEGTAHRRGLTDPIRQWRTADASPSGIAVAADRSIYMAALRGQSLWRIPLDTRGRAGTPQRLLRGTYGRLRTAVAAPDGRLWIITSNTSNGIPRRGDDRIIALRVPVR